MAVAVVTNQKWNDAGLTLSGLLLMGLFLLLAGTAIGNEGVGEGGAKPWKAEPGKTTGWMLKANRLNRQAAALNPDICFVGDSLTEFWNAQGSPIWQLEFQNIRAANLGMAADRTENILWRLNHGALDKIHPKVLVLMLGTNNLSKEPADDPTDVLRGIAAVVKQIQQKLPESRILLLSILPNGYDQGSVLRKQIIKTNASIQKLAIPSKVTIIDAHNAFLNSSGEWRPGLTVDGTHLTMRGYDVLMNQIREPLGKAVE